MELVSTMEINGEEREIADAYAREQIATNTQNIATNAEGIAGLNNNLSYYEQNGFLSRNSFDGVLQNGDLAGDGMTIIPVSDRVISTNLIKVKPNTTYNIKCYDGTVRAYVILGYADKNTVISDGKKYGSVNNKINEVAGNNEITFTTTSTTNYVRFYVTDITDINARFQIEEGTESHQYTTYCPPNTEITKINDSLSVIGKCKNLLNPTLQTTTKNGVTCTNNGDGTYTLNGTNNTDSLIWFELTDFFTLEPNKKYKLVGGYPNSNRPFIDSEALWFLELYNSNQSLLYTRDYGDGRVFATTNTTLAAEIGVRKGATFNNFTFKPMLTECLDATYDDFVPYTGDGDTLSADVASLKNDLSECRKKSDITTNETLIGTFNGKNYYRRLFTGIGASGSSVTVNVGEKIEIYNYYGRAYTYGQSGASNVKYPIPNNNYYIESQNSGETSFQLTIPTSSDTRKVDLVIEYTKVDE